MSDEGRLIAGRYRLHQGIGSGAMGVVWRAVDERLHRTVAVKQLLLQPGYTDEETEEARQRSMREGRIAARLQHQNAIAVFDVAEDEGQPVLVMEYLPSQSLGTVISEQGLLSPQRVAQIGAQVAGALAAAHMAGIVHRDLKPGNILLGDNGISKITDFGISRAIGDVSVTKSGILAGTPAYLSPEVALGRDPAPASDVFSLGSTLYAAIEGEPPFGVDDNAISLLHRVANGHVEPPRQAGPLAAGLMQLLLPDPVDRPTMAHARNILQAVAEGRPIPAGAVGNGRQQAPPSAGPPPSAGRHPGPRQPQGHAPAVQKHTAQQPAVRQPEAGGTRAGGTSRSNPPAQTGAANSTNRSSGRGSRRQSVLLWVMALLIAILVGVLAANAYGGVGKQSQGQPPPDAPPPPPPPAATEPAAAPPSSASATSTTSTTSTTATSSAKDEQPSKQEIQSVVKKYYSLMPHNPDQAWELLGPSLQAQGKQQYKQFWRSIDEVKIVGGPKLTGSNVVVQLLFIKDGKIQTERHKLGMVAKDGKALINTDSGS